MTTVSHSTSTSPFHPGETDQNGPSIMPKISSRSHTVAENIRDRVPFETHGALKATVENGLTIWSSGQLANADLDQFRADQHVIDYAVWSYSTPIAWHTSDGRWHVVAQKFSMTTSHHQGRLYLIPR